MQRSKLAVASALIVVAWLAGHEAAWSQTATPPAPPPATTSEAAPAAPAGPMIPGTESLQKFLSDTGKTVVDGTNRLADSTRQVMTDVQQSVSDGAQAVIDNTQGLVSSTQDAISSTHQSVVEGTSSLVESSRQFASDTHQAASGAAESVTAAMWQLVDRACQSLASVAELGAQTWENVKFVARDIAEAGYVLGVYAARAMGLSEAPYGSSVSNKDGVGLAGRAEPDRDTPADLRLTRLVLPAGFTFARGALLSL